MLGIPYEARMPAPFDRGAQGGWGAPAAPPAPEVVAQRALREEQDAAYQASLLVRSGGPGMSVDCPSRVPGCRPPTVHRR